MCWSHFLEFWVEPWVFASLSSKEVANEFWQRLLWLVQRCCLTQIWVFKKKNESSCEANVAPQKTWGANGACVWSHLKLIPSHLLALSDELKSLTSTILPLCPGCPQLPQVHPHGAFLQLPLLPSTCGWVRNSILWVKFVIKYTRVSSEFKRHVWFKSIQDTKIMIHLLAHPWLQQVSPHFSEFSLPVH